MITVLLAFYLIPLIIYWLITLIEYFVYNEDKYFVYEYKVFKLLMDIMSFIPLFNIFLTWSILKGYMERK